MLATLTNEAFDDENWLFEIKWDGYRAIAEIEEGKINLYSRNNISFNEKFSSVVKSLSRIDHNVILDGEVVSVDEKGVSKFQLLQNYQRTGEGNLLYYLFDIIYLEGYDLKNLPLLERKKILRDILPEIPDIRFSDHIVKDGKAFFSAAEERNLEGIIAKNKNSSYQINRRSRDWLKIKIRKEQEAVIGGFTKPRGSRKEMGALVLGAYDGKDLIYIGHSGGGFTEEALKEIRKKLDPLIRKTSPFKIKPKTNMPATWVEPKLVCEVSFSEWTDEGLMRHPIYLGLREDKNPEEVVIEKADQEVLTSSGNGNSKKEVQTSSDNGNPKRSSDKEIEINKHKLKLTNPDKIYWPKEGYTKEDLINYYRIVARYMLPYLKDRPESLNRYPNGIYEESFFQKDVQLNAAWVKTQKIYSESNDKDINYLICNDEATLVYMANLGCIEINPWFSRITKLDYPDYFVVDLDPEDISFEKVIETALVVKEVLEEAGIKSYCKTSGATGLHIYVPLNAKYDYNVAKDFAHLIVKIVNNRIPEFTSLERSPSKRKKKVYLDYLQNRAGQTLAAPYSVRPRPGATVAAPLKWDEVKPGLSPQNFTMKNIPERLKKIGDIFKPVLEKGIDIKKSIEKLEELLKS